MAVSIQIIDTAPKDEQVVASGTALPNTVVRQAEALLRKHAFPWAWALRFTAEFRPLVVEWRGAADRQLSWQVRCNAASAANVAFVLRAYGLPFKSADAEGIFDGTLPIQLEAVERMFRLTQW